MAENSVGTGGLKKTNTAAVIVCFLLSVFMAVLFIGIGVLFSGFSEKSNSGINEWQYVWVNKIDDLDSSDNVWQKTDSSDFRMGRNGSKYLHLHAVIESRSASVLTVRSGNNLINADVDGTRTVEQLKSGSMYSGTPLTEIILEPSDNPHTVDIYIYVPSVLKFSASIGSLDNNISLQNTAELLFGSAFIGLSVILLIFTAVSKTNKKFIFIITGISCLIFGLSAVLGQSGIYIKQLSSPVFFRAFAFMMMTTSIGIQYIAFKVLEAEKKMGWVTYISVIFPLGFLLAPYDSIALFLLNAFGFWSAASLLIYMITVAVEGVPSYKGRRVIVITFIAEAAIQSLYWISYLIPIRDIPLTQSYIIAAGVYIAAAVIVLLNVRTIIENKAGITESDSKDDILYKKIDKLIAEKADTNNGHLDNVSKYVRVMCRRLKMPDNITAMVADAALLHDIGKIAVPKAILEKEDTVAKEEFEQLRCHVLHGYNILSDPSDQFLQTAAQIAKYHHERYDGTGYLGMKGKEIDLYSRLTAIADTFDALTAYRSYKKAWSFNDACDYINTHSGDYFDPELVKLFNSCRKEFMDIYQSRNNAINL